MTVTTVKAHVSLLLAPDLTAAAKVLWLALRSRPHPVPQTTLAAETGLTLATIGKCLAQLNQGGWYSPHAGPVNRTPAGSKVELPVALLKDPRLRPQAKLLYCLLQTGPAEFTYKALSAQAHISVPTARRAVRELTETGWVKASQQHQLAPIRFVMRGASEAAEAMRRLEEAEFRGEAIMREYLSLLIDSDEFEDNARPGFLVNPLTGERMELDRYYPAVAAFEFQGAQHFRTTERFPNEQTLAMQQTRDLVKEALCARRGIRLIAITGSDLYLEAIQRKVSALLPQRDLSGHEELIALLERVRRQYRL